MNNKLHVLVRVDLDGAWARVEAMVEVTVGSVQALYVVARRANALMPGLPLMLDLSHALVARDALEELHACSESGHLPTRSDPLQPDCRLSILDPEGSALQAGMTGLAARVPGPIFESGSSRILVSVGDFGASARPASRDAVWPVN